MLKLTWRHWPSNNWALCGSLPCESLKGFLEGNLKIPPVLALLGDCTCMYSRVLLTFKDFEEFFGGEVFYI